MSQTDTPTQDPTPSPALAPEGETPLIVGDPVLMDTLASLDRDINGETKFCLQAAEALRAFQARWTSDVALEDGYGQAIKALDNMPSILAGAEVRWTQELTRQVTTRQEADRRTAYATVEREHALTWAEQPPPVPPAPDTPPTPAPYSSEPAPYSSEPPPEAGVRE
jgi:hypothetical protein